MGALFINYLEDGFEELRPAEPFPCDFSGRKGSGKNLPGCRAEKTACLKI